MIYTVNNKIIKYKKSPLFFRIRLSKQTKIRMLMKNRRREYHGGAGSKSIEKKNMSANDLEGLLDEQWLSNDIIDIYLGKIIQTRGDITIHDSDVALLLQGGAGEFLDRNYLHPSNWRNKNLIPTIVRRSEYEGYHWVLLEIEMRNKVVKLYDSMGIGLQYQTELLSVIVSTMDAEVHPYGGWTAEVVEGMEVQKDMNSCGIYVTAWAENAMATGEVANCIIAGEEKKLRKKIYDSLSKKQVTRNCDKKIQEQQKLDKYLHKRTRSRIIKEQGVEYMNALSHPNHIESNYSR